MHGSEFECTGPSQQPQVFFRCVVDPLGAEGLLIDQLLRRRHIRHFRLMLEANLVDVKSGHHRKDLMAMLNRLHPTPAERSAIA